MASAAGAFINPLWLLLLKGKSLHSIDSVIQAFTESSRVSSHVKVELKSLKYWFQFNIDRADCPRDFSAFTHCKHLKSNIIINLL
jgi:hypothetical protein